ncbi:Uncharacterized protein dnm_016850 [Desulfonema magnum]|uniref:Uncharacterized protein n=1 Tax=Desulfonema magnum TaxID=45655 RepID=A0A975BHW8_9BACT|nr:Uncharacterized protein dnm_016850 [Desulfonema magnum]
MADLIIMQNPKVQGKGIRKGKWAYPLSLYFLCRPDRC